MCRGDLRARGSWQAYERALRETSETFRDRTNGMREPVGQEGITDGSRSSAARVDPVAKRKISLRAALARMCCR